MPAPLNAAKGIIQGTVPGVLAMQNIRKETIAKMLHSDNQQIQLEISIFFARIRIAFLCNA